MILLLGITASRFFKDSVFGSWKGEIWASPLAREVERVCSRWGLPPRVKDTVMMALVLHRLLLSDAAVSPEKPSPLGIRYIWLDQRKRILKDGKPLRRPALEQTPDRFFSNLFSPKPRFYDPLDDKHFYAYGWCSELEMAYANALGWLGIPARIVFVGPIHVASAVKVAGREFTVDNSFGGFFEEEWTHAENWDSFPLSSSIHPDTVKKWSRWYNRRFKTRSWDGPLPRRARERLKAALRKILAR